MPNVTMIRKYDYRCRTKTCNRLLFRAYLPADSMLDIRCPACGAMHKFSGNEREVAMAVVEEAAGIA